MKNIEKKEDNSGTVLGMLGGGGIGFMIGGPVGAFFGSVMGGIFGSAFNRTYYVCTKCGRRFTEEELKHERCGI